MAPNTTSDSMIVDSQVPQGNQSAGNPQTVPVARDLAAERDAERAREVAAAKAKESDRFTVRKFTAGPRPVVPSAPEYETLMLKSAANHKFQDLVYPTVSTYVPNLVTFFQILHHMDLLMCNTRKWTENCQGWAPPISQMFFSVCIYYQIFVAMDSAGIANQDIMIFIQLFERTFPLSEIWIPGPLVAAFRALSAFRPDANDLFAGVTPSVPATPGFTTAGNYNFTGAHLAHLLPNLSIFLSRLRAICATAAASADEATFQAAMDGPTNVQHVFGTQVANNATYQGLLVCPGVPMRYGGNRDLWVKAGIMLNMNSMPADLVQATPTPVNDTWTAAIRFESNEHVWFAPAAAMMAKYCQFWNGSVPLSEIRPVSSAAGAVKLRTVGATSHYTIPNFVPAAAAAPPVPAILAHFVLRDTMRTVTDGQLALRDVPDAHVYSAITFNFNCYWNNASQVACRLGRFWTLGPDVGSNLSMEVIPGTLQTISREYHRDTRLEAHKQ